MNTEVLKKENKSLKAKIAVTLTGRNIEELQAQAELAAKSHADIVEWRTDFFDASDDPKQLVEASKTIRTTIGTKELILAFRTKAEGGVKNLEIPLMLLMYKTIMLTKCVDMIDVELLLGDTIINQIVKHAKLLNQKVIISNNDPDSTPDADILMKRVETMANKGGDIVRIGMTPRSAAEVDTVIDVCKKGSQKYAMIAYSNTEMGKITKIDAAAIGSQIAFATLDASDDNGNLNVEDLYNLMK